MKQYLLAVHSVEGAADPVRRGDADHVRGDRPDQRRDAGRRRLGLRRGSRCRRTAPPSSGSENGTTTMTDGPFAETKEQLGGFWVIRCADLDEALAWAEKCAAACMGPVEVRPLRRPTRQLTGSRSPDMDLASVYRAEYGRCVATLARLLGDINLAEEAVQDAFAAALQKWETLPPNPGAWIVTTARNRAIDRLRRESTREARHAQALLLHQQDEPQEVGPVRDDQLRLIFTCCHPALAPDARTALTLRLLGGLEVPEIARAYLVPEATVAQRIVRAKKKIRDAGIPYRVPAAAGAAGPAAAGADGALPDVQRGLRGHRRAADQDRPVRRGDPARPGARRADARRARGPRPARPAAADRGPPAGPARPRPASWCCWPTRTGRCGTGRSSPRATTWSAAACGATGPARTRSRRRSTRCTPTAPPPTGRRSWRSTTSCWRWCRRRSSRSTGRSPSPRCTGRRWRSPRWRTSICPATTCSPPPGPTCSPGSDATPRPRAAYDQADRTGQQRDRAGLPADPSYRTHP